MLSPLDAIHRNLSATLSPTAAAEGAAPVTLPLHYGDPDAEVRAAQQGAGLLDLSHLPAFSLESPDAKRWSNGMFTNNIRRLQPGQGGRSAMCDDRGRVQGLLDLYCVRDDLFIGVLDGVSLASFQKRYQMFMVLDDIEFEGEEGPPWILSLQGPRATEVLAAAGLPVPAPPDASHAHTEADGVHIARKDRTGLGGYDLICADDAAAQRTWAALAGAGATPIGQQALESLRVLAGRARWPQDGTDKSMVHELALNEEVCAIDKGCYVGQEVINRIDVKGAIQKRLAGLRLPVPPPPLGSPVFQEDKEIGTLTSAVQVGDAAYGLGVLRKTAWEPGTPVEIRPEGGAPVAATVAALPFPEVTRA